MPLSAATRAKVDTALREWEGCANFLYLDTKGKVTIAVGHLVALKDDVKVIPLSADGGPATKESTEKEKLDEYDRVNKLLSGKLLSYYRKTAKLFVKDSYIDASVSDHIDTFYANLVDDYTKANGYLWEFDDAPENIQLALFDMIFNLGRSGLKNKFPSFNKALKKPDYATAKKESNRPDVSDNRNAYVAGMFDTLIAEQKAAADKAKATTPAAPGATPAAPGTPAPPAPAPPGPR